MTRNALSPSSWNRIHRNGCFDEVIDEKADDTRYEMARGDSRGAGCSACPGVVFGAKASGHRPNRDESQKSIQAQVEEQCKAVHSQGWWAERSLAQTVAYKAFDASCANSLNRSAVSDFEHMNKAPRPEVAVVRVV